MSCGGGGGDAKWLLRNRDSDDEDEETGEGDERKAELGRTVVKHSPDTPFAGLATPSPPSATALSELSFWRLGCGNLSLICGTAEA